MSVVWALVPVKELGQAKTRLASVLSADERRALMLAMLDGVLQALFEVPEITQVLVITRDDGAAEVAQQSGASVLRESSGSDLNAALREGIKLARDSGAISTLIIPADVPATTAAEIQQVLAGAAPAPSVTLAPAEDGDGTNALLLSPPDVIALSYGAGSCQAHTQAGQAAGATVTRLDLPGLALDLDEPLDLATFLQRQSRGATYRMLTGLDLHPRLLQIGPRT